MFTVRFHPAAPAVPRASGAEAGTVTDVGDTRGFLPKAPCPCKQSRTVLLLAGCTCAVNFRWSEPDCVLCSQELQSASESCSEMPPFFGAAGINISLSSTALLLLRLFHARARKSQKRLRDSASIPFCSCSYLSSSVRTQLVYPPLDSLGSLWEGRTPRSAGTSAAGHSSGLCLVLHPPL